MKHLFILNPEAGKGKATKLIPVIKEYFSNKPEECIMEITRYPGHATEIAAYYSAQEDLRIYSVGGDGTLNEVLNGMAGTGSSLADIPGGSGNDFIRSIYNKKADPADIIARTVEGEERLIDFAKVNDKYFINIASLGFDAYVAHKTVKYKKLPLISGRMAYMLGIFTSILECSNHYMEMKVDDTILNTRTLLVAVGNGRYYGGKIKALPHADVRDGLFDICHADAMGRLHILRLLPKYVKGEHETIKEVRFFRGKKVEIIPDCPIPINMDGEVSIVDRAVFEIIPNGLKFVYPRE